MRSHASVCKPFDAKACPAVFTPTRLNILEEVYCGVGGKELGKASFYPHQFLSQGTAQHTTALSKPSLMGAHFPNKARLWSGRGRVNPPPGRLAGSFL